MYLNQLIIPCKPSASFNTTTHHKTNFQHHKYRNLQVFKAKKILFVISNQQYSFTFARNKKHSQYVFKPPCNTVHATYLLQHNNLPQIQFPKSQVFKSNNILFITSNSQYLFTFARHSLYVFKPPYNTSQATRLL